MSRWCSSVLRDSPVRPVGDVGSAVTPLLGIDRRSGVLEPVAPATSMAPVARRPRADGALTAPTRSERHDPRPRRRRRPRDRPLVAFRLARLGLHVSVEADGQAGLAAVRELRPDLVVLDWMMPRMNGLEVCPPLRTDPDPSLARTPVLLLTAKAQEPDLERGFAAGATDYVVKPFSTRELATRVTAALPPGSVSA